MKNLFRYFIFLSVILFIPLALSGQPDTVTSGQPFKISIPGWVWIAGGTLLGFIAGAALIYIYSRAKIFSILNNEKRKYIKDLKNDSEQTLSARQFFSYVGVVAMLKKSKDEKAEIILKKNLELRELKERNEDLRAEYAQKEKALRNRQLINEGPLAPGASSASNQAGQPVRTEAPRAGQPVRTEPLQPLRTEIFFTIPESDGTFRSVNAKSVQEIDCYYKIEPDKNGQSGRLYFIPGNYDMRALDNIDYYLNPVCEIQNIINRTNARKIVMTASGVVVRRGDHWKVEESNKVKIKLV
jgi:hypothetical protein